MAYVDDLSDEDKKKAEDQGAGVRTSGVLDGAVSSGGNTGTPTADTKAPGTGFVNLQQYLDTNKGAGGKLASDSTKDLASSADAYQQKAASTVDASKSAFGAATGTDAAGKINDNIQKSASVYKDAAKDFLGQGYTGPAATDYTAGLAADKKNITDNLGQVDNQTYQQQALANTYGKTGNYTKGFGTLDSFLINGDQSGRDKLAEVKGKAAGVDQAYDTSAATLNKAEADAKAKLAENKQGVVNTALNTQANIEAAAKAKAAQLNQGNAGKMFGQAASLGDGLNSQNRLDLQALADIANQENNADWNKLTYKQGAEAPNQPAIAVTGGVKPPNTSTSLGPVDQVAAGINAGANKLAPVVDTANTLANAPSNVNRELSKVQPLNPTIDQADKVVTAAAKPLSAIDKVGDNIARETVNGALPLANTASKSIDNNNINAAQQITNKLSLPGLKPVTNTVADTAREGVALKQKAEAEAAKAAQAAQATAAKAKADAAKAAATAAAQAKAAAKKVEDQKKALEAAAKQKANEVAAAAKKKADELAAAAKKIVPPALKKIKIKW